MCLFSDEVRCWAEKLSTYIKLPLLMPDEDNNFGGFLDLDCRKWWRHVQPKNPMALPQNFRNWKLAPIKNLKDTFWANEENGIFFLIWKQLKIFMSYRFFKISAPNTVHPHKLTVPKKLIIGANLYGCCFYGCRDCKGLGRVRLACLPS